MYQVALDIEGKKAMGIIRELQQHPTKDTIQHVDFYELNDAKVVSVKLPVRLIGSARGVLAGGRLMQIELPLTQERHHGYHDADPDYREVQSKKNYDRILDKYRGKTTILSARR